MAYIDPNNTTDVITGVFGILGLLGVPVAGVAAAVTALVRGITGIHNDTRGKKSRDRDQEKNENYEGGEQ